MVAPGFGRPIWLVQLSLLEAPAVVRLRTPRPRISHSQSIFLIYLFFFCIFLLVGFVQIDVCRGGLVLLEVCPSGGLFSFLSFSSSACQKIFVFDLSSQRNKEV